MSTTVPPTPRLVRELNFKVIKEEWLTIRVKDDSIIKFKPVLLKLFETDQKDPATDEPIVLAEGHNVVSVRSPQNLLGEPSKSLPDPSEALKMPKEEVDIIEISDPSWNLYELETGKRLKTKPVITSVHRIKDIYDRHRNPYYVVRSQMVVSSSHLRVQPHIEPSAEGIRQKWPPLSKFFDIRTRDESDFGWESLSVSSNLVQELPLYDWTTPNTTHRDRWSKKQKFESIETFLNSIHKMVKGRLSEWKEEEHKADKLLFELVKREKHHENP